MTPLMEFGNSDRAKWILGVLDDNELLPLFFFFTLRKSIKYVPPTS
jgi:hypothetical protein